MARSRLPLLLLLSGLGAGCRFAPDLSAYPACDQGACPEGYQCLASEQICLPAGEADTGADVADAGASDIGPGTDAGRPDGSVPVVDAGPLRFSTLTLPEGREGVLYLQVLQAAGGARPYTFSVASGGLPAGLALTAQGTLSGTPGTAGAASFAVQVTDATSQVAAQAFTLSVAPATGTALAIETLLLPEGQADTAYQASLVASGGIPPYQWTVASGALPGGLSLAKAGVLSGTPTSSGETTLTLAVADSSATPQSALRPYALRVNPAQGEALAITTAALPDGEAGAYYLAQLAATGGTLPHSWSLSGGSVLPAGLSLSPGGSLSGTPTGAGSTNFTAQVSDTSSPVQTSSRTLTLSISGGSAPPLSVTTSTLPEGTVGIAYATTIVASGGTPPVTFTLSAGSSLPAGVSLAPTGLLSGTPGTAGVFSVGISAADASTPSQVATRAYVLTIGTGTTTTPLSITTGVLAAGVVGVAYTQYLTANGGTPPYSWSLSSGALPSGLGLGANGLISGAPTMAGGFTFTARVTDSAASPQVASRGFSINVQPAALYLDPTVLPAAQVGVAYKAQLTATGGTQPYSFSLLNGTLPKGLTLCATSACGHAGEITGVPQGKSHNQFEAQVADASNPMQIASRQFILDVN